MAATNRYTVAYRRRREGKTNYRRRRNLLLGSKPRLVVRKSNRHLVLQISTFNPHGDRIIASAHTSELAKHGWKAHNGNTSAAYLTGVLLAKKAKQKTPCVLDIGQHTSTKGNLLYAAVQGAVDGGLNIPCSKDIIPNEKRIRGEHIADYAKKLKADKERYERQFSKYLKMGLDPEKLPSHFDEIKQKLLKQ